MKANQFKRIFSTLSRAKTDHSNRIQPLLEIIEDSPYKFLNYNCPKGGV